MARSVTTRIVFNRIPQISAAMAAGVATAVDQTLTAIEQDVKGGAHAAPYRTGNLRRSYHKEKTGPFSGTVGNALEIAEYAIYVEMGTVNMSAQPHLLPSAEAQVAPLRARVAAALKAVR